MEGRFCPIWPVQDELILSLYPSICTQYLKILLQNFKYCYSTWKFRKTSNSTLPFMHQRAKTDASWQEHNHRTCWWPARSSEFPACVWVSTPQVLTTVKYHSCRLRVYSWSCPTEQMDPGESAPSPLSFLKCSQLPMLLKPRATEHTLCVLGAWLCHLAWSSRTRAAELAGVTDSFKGLFILVVISKECKSLTKPTKGCCL